MKLTFCTWKGLPDDLFKSYAKPKAQRNQQRFTNGRLLTVLQGKGIPLAAAVGLGAIVGPSQVGARAIELLIARHHHPIWTKAASVSILAVGLALLWAGGPLLTVALVCYGAGIGLESIARGTLPLAIFGPDRYPVLMGRIALPNLVAQAASPAIGAGLFGSGLGWRVSSFYPCSGVQRRFGCLSCTGSKATRI